MKSNNTERRHTSILKMLRPDEIISVNSFCQSLQCSPSTIRNDLNYLAEQKKIIRTFGGAKGLSSNPVEQDSVHSEITPVSSDRDIALYAVEHLIQPDTAIILENSSTSIEIARILATKEISITVFTFSLCVVNILIHNPSINLYFFGGAYEAKRNSFFDPQNIPGYTKNFHADIYFLQTSSVSSEAGFTIACQDIPVTETALMEMSTKTVAMCDSANLCKSSWRIIADFSRINTMITDSQASPEHIQRLRNAGLNVLMPEKSTAK